MPRSKAKGPLLAAPRRRALVAGVGALLLTWAPAAAQEGARREGPAPARSASEWNERGAQAIRERRFEEAMAAFGQALELAPEDAVIRLNLARAHAYHGQALLEAGRVPDALTAFEAGAAVERDGGVLETLAAYAQVRLGRRGQARARLERVLADFPGNLEAAVLAADLAAVEGRLQQAVEILDRALDGQEDAARAADGVQPAQVARALSRRQQLREESRAWEGFLTDSSAHFDYRYDPHRPDLVDAMPLLMLDLEDAYQSVAEVLGLAPEDRILVLVLDQERYRGGAPEWSGGLYDGRIRLAVHDYARDREQHRATLRHEYTHAALHRLGAQLPTWLHEGLAQMVEGRSVAAGRGRLRALGSEAWPDLKALQDDWTRWSDRGQVQAAYDYALSLATWLREVHGAAVFRLLFEQATAHGFDEGWQRTLAHGLETLDRQHREALRAREG